MKYCCPTKDHILSLNFKSLHWTGKVTDEEKDIELPFLHMWASFTASTDYEKHVSVTSG